MGSTISEYLKGDLQCYTKEHLINKEARNGDTVSFSGSKTLYTSISGFYKTD